MYWRGKLDRQTYNVNSETSLNCGRVDGVWTNALDNCRSWMFMVPRRKKMGVAGEQYSWLYDWLGILLLSKSVRCTTWQCTTWDLMVTPDGGRWLANQSVQPYACAFPRGNSSSRITSCLQNLTGWAIFLRHHAFSLFVVDGTPAPHGASDSKGKFEALIGLGRLPTG
jgi:hypothetical protein